MENDNELQSTISLDEVVNQVLNELDGDDSQYFKMYSLGLRCLRDLHSSFTGEFKEETLEILANSTALLPDDFINDIGVGLINPRGEFFALRKNKLITRNLQPDCERIDQATVGGQAIPFSGNYVDSTVNGYSTLEVAGSYGVGSDSDYGTYDIDIESGLILFDFRVSSGSYSNVVLRYLPMYCLDGAIYMPSLFVETVIAFIVWKSKQHKKNMSAYDKSEAKKGYENERRRLLYMMRAPKFAQIMNNSRRNQRSSPRA